MERLIVIENGEEKIINITSRVVSIGRSSKNDIPLKDRNSSRRHCNVLKVGDTWFAVDCDSQNGTFVNGEKIKKKELEDGDKITIGSVDILFVLTENIESVKDSPSKPKDVEDELPPIQDSVLDKDSVLKKEEAIPEKKEAEELEQAEKMLFSNKNPIAKPSEDIEAENTLSSYKKKDSVKPEEQEEDFLEMQKTIPPQAISFQELNAQAVLKRIQKCYELFRNCLIPEITTDEEIPEFLFMALISGGHCFLEGSSRLHQYVLLNRLSFSLGLSTKTILLTPGQKLWQMSGNYNLVLLENLQGSPSEIESFFLKNTPDMALPGSPLASTQNSTMIVFCSPQEKNDIFSEINSYFMFRMKLSEPDLTQQLLLLEPIKIEEKKENIVTANEEILFFQKAVFNMPVSLEVKQYIGKILNIMNPFCLDCPEEIAVRMRKNLDIYSGILILKAAKAWAAMNAKSEVSKEDIQKVLPSILIPRLWLYIHRSEHEDANPTFLFQKMLEKLDN